MLAVRELLGSMRPVRGKAASDGVVGLADENLEIVTRTVAGIEARAFRDAHQRSAGPDGDSGSERFVAPAEADHIVESGPFEKGIVGGVEDDQSASLAHVSFE